MRTHFGWSRCLFAISALVICVGASPQTSEPAAERGRAALTTPGPLRLRPGWRAEAFRNAGKLWGDAAPQADAPTDVYSLAFNYRYGLHPAPFPNDGLPMGLRPGMKRDGTKDGLQIDCLLCHGGSIGGTSYVGLGNTTIDLSAFLSEMTKADGRRLPPSLFHLNTSRGTVNAGMIAAVLLSLRNADLSERTFPLLLGANLPELDVPPWWHMARKKTMYYDGRTDARSARTNMQFLLGEKSAQDFKDLEPTFQDIQAFLKSLRPPKYPFAIDNAAADRGKVVFAQNCQRCHGTYGPEGVYPNKIIALDIIGTDPARALGLSDRLVAHYSSTWLGQDFPVDPKVIGYQAPPLDGIWATAPYLHNGSAPTLAVLLKSSDRPARFRRHPTTDFAHYDQVNVGWKFEATESAPAPVRPFEGRFIFDSARFGLGNQGHTFGDSLEDRQRSDLIEFLKTL